MHKYISLSLLIPILACVIPVHAQEYDKDEARRLDRSERIPILVSQKVLSAIQKTNKNTKEQAQESLVIFQDLIGRRNLSQTDRIVVDNMLAKYYMELGDYKTAIERLNSLLNNEKTIKSMELGAYSALAISYHNIGNNLLSILNMNQWSIYNIVNFHQLLYMQADNYLEIGDIKNAYTTYLEAKKLTTNFLLLDQILEKTLVLKTMKPWSIILKNDFHLQKPISLHLRK